MSVTLNSIAAQSGDFITRLIGGAVISAGASGDLVTLTPPSGQRVRLTHLSNVAALTESNISVIVGGVDVTGVVSINGGAPTGSSRSVGSFQAYAAGNPPNGNHTHLTGGTDEVVVIRKTTGSTSNDLYYSYQFGE